MISGGRFGVWSSPDPGGKRELSPFARGPARAPEPFAAFRTDAARWAELRAAGDRFAAFAAANRDAGERFGRLFRMLGARP